MNILIYLFCILIILSSSLIIITIVDKRDVIFGKKKINVINCDCEELNTNHSARISHKLRCPIFRKLNKNLTTKEFMISEGFPNEKDFDWPSISQNKNDILH